MERDDRRAQLAAGLERVTARIETACTEAGRQPGDVQLIVVTKTYPASDVRLLAELGVADVGENRDQEAAAKAADVGEEHLRWHFIGQLQTNKAKSVARYADVVHSVDREPLVTALGKGAETAERRLGCLIQVSLDGDTSRGGARIENVGRLADLVANHASLDLLGVMAVAPLDTDPDAAFATLAEVSQQLLDVHPNATHISAGMSGDLESAIRHDATYLRVGSAVLGERPPLRYRQNAGQE